MTTSPSKSYSRTATSSQYAVADDPEENARLEAQAEHLSAIMNGKLLHAPVDKANIERVLDIGCGTGAITQYLSQTLPKAELIGLDINPVVKPRAYPPNVHFFQGDIMTQSPTQWRRLMDDRAHTSHVNLSDENAFDLIFSRLIVDLIPNGLDLIARSFTLLRPGGWSEHHEIDLVWYNGQNEVISDDWPWWQLARNAGKASGLDFAVGSQVQQKMREAGFVEVGVREYRWPFGGEWESESAWQAFGEYVATEMVKIFDHSIEKAAQWAGNISSEQVSEMKEDMRKDLKPEQGKHWKFWVTYGRKPA